MIDPQLIYIAVSLVVGWLARHWGIGAPSQPPVAPSPGGAPSQPPPHPVIMAILSEILALLKTLPATQNPPAR